MTKQLTNKLQKNVYISTKIDIIIRKQIISTEIDITINKTNYCYQY